MRKAVCITVSALLAITVAAQEDSTAKALEEVVMVAQRTTQRKAQTPYSVEMVSQKTIRELGLRTTPEAMTGLPGVFVQKTNHGGGSPFLRGLTGNQVLVLVDGIRLNNSTFRYGPNQYLNTVDAYAINRVEVARGTGSVQYGSDALGGVIQVLTRDPQLTDKRSANGRIIGKYATSDMEKTIRGEAGYSSKAFGLNAGITRRDFGDLIGGDTTGRQSPSGYQEWAYDLKAKWRLGEEAELILANGFLRQSNVPVYHKLRLENFAVNEMHPQQRMLSYARLRLKNRKSLFAETELTASHQRTLEGRASRKAGSGTLRKEKDEVNTLGFTVDNFSRLSNSWTANTGVEIYTDNVNSLRQDINLQTGAAKYSRGLYPDDARYGNYSVYSLHHLALNRFSFEAGLRYNFFSIRINDTSLGRVSISPSALVANGAVLYSINRVHNLYVSYSSGYRAPNVDDMGTLGVVDFRYELPTASLRPESSRSIEAGYKIETKKLSASVAGYYMRLTDLIARVKRGGEVINGYPVHQKQNTEKAFIKGLEAALEWRPFATFSFAGNIAYAYGENETKPEPLRRIPPLNGRLLASWRPKLFFFGTEWLFAAKQDRLAQGDKDDNRIPAGGTPGFGVLNVYAGYQIAILQLNAGAQNLLNEDYRTHGSGINGVGRSAWLSATVSF